MGWSAVLCTLPITSAPFVRSTGPSAARPRRRRFCRPASGYDCAMEGAVIAPLRAWETFYVIVGSSAAALTGLQFVVMALIAESRRRSSLSQIDAFGTPTIVHFCSVLLVAAILTAPWQRLPSAALGLGGCGAAR